MSVVELAQLVAVVLGLAATVGGGLWWLVWPRIEDKLQEVARGVASVHEQLSTDGDVDGTVGEHAAQAARAAAQLPQLRALVEQVARRQAEVDELRLPERLQLVELQVENTERRVGSIEQAVIAQLGSQLRTERRGNT